MTQTKERLVEFDVLRVFALLLILYMHSVSYILEIPVLDWFRLGGMYTGLGLFVFLSGYSLQYSISSRTRHNRFSSIEFLKRRLIRIYPLYIVAIFAYIAVFHYLNIFHDWKYFPLPETLTLHIFSLQAIFHPNYPEIHTLWFIGMIVPFYLFFAFSAQYKTRTFLIINIVIFAGLLTGRLIFETIDLRLFVYYPLFVIGCLYERASILKDRYVSKRGFIFWIFILFSFGLYFILNYFEIPEIPTGRINNFKQWISFGLIFAYMVASVTALLAIASQYSHLFQRFKRAIAYLAKLSYPAYLFHRIVYGGFYFLLDSIGLSMKVGTVLFPVITVFLFLTAALITQCEEKLFKKLSQKHTLQS